MDFASQPYLQQYNGERMSTHFLPDGITSLVTVEVYLPKNLRNYGALIELLSETLEFASAKDWMVKKASKLFSLHSWPKTGGGSRFADADESRSQARPDLDSPANFEKYVGDMVQTIVGYSVYEVDGAFQSFSRGRVVPLAERWDVEMDDETVDAVKAGDLRRCLELLSSRRILDCEPEYTLPASYTEHLQTGPAASKFVAALKAEGCPTYPKYEFSPYDSDTWLLRRCQQDQDDVESGRHGSVDFRRPTPALVIKKRSGKLAVYELAVAREGDDSSYSVRAGGSCFWIGRRAKEKQYQLCPAIPLLEERTCVIRFMAETSGVESGNCNVLGQPLEGSNNAVYPLPNKKLWDTIMLISYYFVYNLGDRVGIEDEIWLVYNGSSELWRWKKEPLPEAPQTSLAS